MFICGQWIYAGTVQSADNENIMLKDAEIIYDSGPASAKYWSEAEKLGDWNIIIASIESWGICEKTLKPGSEEKPHSGAMGVCNGKK